MRVMLVDDEQPSLDELVFLLSKCPDIEIVGAYLSPLQALEAARLSMPDAVFLDLVMPRMGGTELAERFLAMDAAVRVVFVTAYGKQLAAAAALHAAGHLLKPVSEAKLGAVLAQLRADLRQRGLAADGMAPTTC